MTVAFKFAKAEYVDAALEDGRLRLTPAAELRQDDGVDAGRSDPWELTAAAEIAGGDEVMSSEHPALQGLVTVVRGGVSMNVDLAVTGDTFSSSNEGLLFCTALECSDALVERMANQFGADAHYRITDIEAFGGLLERHLRTTDGPDVQVRQGPVRYDATIAGRIADLGAPNPFSKNPRFSWQQEHRIVVTGLVPQSRVVTVPEICHLLRKGT